MIRVFANGLRIHLMQLVRSPFDIVAMLVWPVIFASIAYYLIGVDAKNSVLFTASLGAAVMMMWSQVIVGSGFALDQQRNQGTLELLVAAPVPLVTVIAPIMIASGAFGIYGLLVTLAVGARSRSGSPSRSPTRSRSSLAAAVSILAIGLLGMIAASLFVLSRAASYLGVALQYPVYLASGLLVPLAMLPAWLGPISWIVAPTWGYRAFTHAADGSSAWPQIGMCLRPQRRLHRRRAALPCLVRAARTRPCQPEALVNWLRVFFHGGLTSYRALFAWLNPWIFLPMLVAYPLFQTVFFVYLGRAANVANSTFFVIGNSFVAAAVTGLFGMGQGIAGERRFQTLSILLASPASRLALFLGRAVPTMVNGFIVALITFALGAALVGVSIDRVAYWTLGLALARELLRLHRARHVHRITHLPNTIDHRLRRRDRRRAPARHRRKRAAWPPPTDHPTSRRLHPAHAWPARIAGRRRRSLTHHGSPTDRRRTPTSARLLLDRTAATPVLRTRRPPRRLVRPLLNERPATAPASQ